MSNALSLNINVALRNAVNVIGVLCFMLALSWPLTAVTLASLPPTLVVSKVYGQYFKTISKKTQKALAEATEVAEEALGSVRTIRAFAGEPYVAKDFAERLDEFCRQNRREANYVVGYTFCLTATPMIVTVLVLWYGGMLVLHGMLNPGALVSFMLYQQQLTGCFSAIADVFTAITTALGAAEKVLELIAAEPKFHTWPSERERREDRGARRRPETCRGLLRLENVRFAYPSRPERLVLTDFDLSVAPGETVALVGPSGGGKSSVINLVERFYVPRSGRVTLDGIDLGELDPRWLKRRVSLVAQEPTLFNRSLRRNIVFGLERTAENWDGDANGRVRRAPRRRVSDGAANSWTTGKTNRRLTISSRRRRRRTRTDSSPRYLGRTRNPSASGVRCSRGDKNNEWPSRARSFGNRPCCCWTRRRPRSTPRARRWCRRRSDAPWRSTRCWSSRTD